MPQFTIQVPDGRKVTVQADDQDQALAGIQDWYTKEGRTNASGSPDDRSSTPPSLPAPPESYDQSYLSQGLSGLNEGIIAKGLGGPVDLVSGAINLGTSGINALAHTNIPQITDPFLGSGTFEHLMAGTGVVSPESSDPNKRMLRRTMEEIGASLLPSGLTAKANIPILAAQLGLSGLSGLGAATAQRVFPGNQIAETIGETAGILTGAGGAKLGAKLMSNSVPQRLGRALEADAIAPNEIAARLHDLGPGATVADLGPNMQGMAAALATTPGPARNTIVTALGDRMAGGNARVRQGVGNILGPPVPESQFQTGIDVGKQALSPEYEDVFRNKALSPNFAMDSGPIVDSIDQIIPNTVGRTRSRLQAVKRMFSDPNGGVTQDPQNIMAVRKELDGMINEETNTTTKGYLKSLRATIDKDLGAQVPGLKDVDAKFADLAKQGEQFDFGKTLLKGGDNAVDPADLAGAIIQGSSGQGNARAQGLLNTIYKTIGTNANDRQALAKILLGDGSWNREKLALQFGPDKADDLVKLFEQEKVKAATENLALANSKTAAVTAAQKEESGANKPKSFIRSALNFQAGDAAAAVADKVLGTSFQQRRAGDNAKLAQLLMSGGINPSTVSAMAPKRIGRALVGPAAALVLNGVGR